ncbi:MAG TPA: MFS transporter [Candidatus Coprenecus stercoravium]|uniref:MFS transporter n=1 Tax=Candidatus Coprenecus stercoravium TaxID=2840735 RepID=A0A9D2K968_9BACT|nr:MFS transporter [Candidatus Coprenecus stercoravium]
MKKVELKSGTGQEETVVGNLQWDGLHRPKIYYAVASICCGIFLSVMDGNICNVALPTIARELGVSSADSIWIVNSFQLIIMMTLLAFSSLGELLSYRRVYISGVVLFTVGSLFCALSHTLPLLIASRVFQGIGAAMIMSVNTTLIKIIYPKKYLGKGVGINATVVAIASVAGPTLAAGILSFAPWPWLFAINIPVGIVTFFMAFRHLPDNPTHVKGRHFNFKDALLNAAVFGLLIGCIEMYSHGARPTTVLIGAALLLILGYIYVKSQLDRKYPMLPFDLLRIPVFSISVVTSIVSFTAQMMAMVAMPFLLLHTFGMNAVETGLLMTSWPLITVFVAPLAGSLIGRIHPGILGCFGLLLMSTGCFLLSFIPEDASHLDIAWRLMMCGAGFGFFQSPNNHMLLSSAPNHRAGSAGGMLATARLVGQSTGAALVALFFHLFGDMAPHDAMLLAGILTVCGAVSSVSRLGLRPPVKER